MGRQKVKEKEKVNVWRPKEISVAPYFPKGWEMIEA